MKVLVILISCLVFVSCKKGRFDNENEFLIGKWNWTHSDRTTGWCENMAWSTTVTPETYSSDFSVVFTQKGKIQFYENNILLDEYKVKSTTTEFIDTSNIKFSMSFSGTENQFYGSGSTSKLKFSRFPFIEEAGCGYYINYFVKE